MLFFPALPVERSDRLSQQNTERVTTFNWQIAGNEIDYSLHPSVGVAPGIGVRGGDGSSAVIQMDQW